ncbi:MAG: DUF1559 domain-containing protein [Pirellulales bacterium]
MNSATTYIAPNTKAVCQNTNNKLKDLKAWPLDYENNSSFMSMHPGVVVFAMCDGSTKIVNDSVDIDVYRRVGSMADGLPEPLENSSGGVGSRLLSRGSLAARR